MGCKFVDKNGKKVQYKEEIVRQSFDDIAVKSGVQELFSSNIELANIGTIQQYSKYLDTIFPYSEVKDIVYRGTEDKERFEHSEIGSIDNASVFGKGFYFSEKKSEALKYNENIHLYILNVTNPINVAFTDDSIGMSVREAKSILYNKEIPIENDGVFVNENNLKSEIIVKDKQQIHILGSKQDIDGFKEFMSNLSNPINTSLLAINRDGELSSIALKDNAYVSDQTQLSSDLIVNLAKIYRNDNSSEAIGNVLRDFVAEDVVSVLQDENNSLQSKLNDNLTLEERISFGMKQLSKGNRVGISKQLLLHDTIIWLNNANYILDINKEHLLEFIGEPIQGGNTNSIKKTEEQTDENQSDVSSVDVSEQQELLNEITLGYDRAKKTGQSLAAVFFYHMPYGAHFNGKPQQSINDVVKNIYNEMKLGMVNGIKVIDIPISIVRDGQEISVIGKDITDIDIYNNPSNSRLANKRNIYKAYELATKGDDSLILHLMKLGLKGVDIDSMFKKSETEDSGQNGGEKSFHKDTVDISDMMSSDLKFLLNNIAIDKTNPDSGVFNGTEIANFFKWLKTSLTTENHEITSYYQIGNTIGYLLKNNKFTNRNRKIAEAIIRDFFKDDFSINTQGSITASVNGYIGNRDNIIASFKNINDNKALVDEYTKNLDEKIENLRDVRNALYSWIKSANGVQAAVADLKEETTTNYSAISLAKSTHEYKSIMKEQWGLGLALDTFTLSDKVSDFYNNRFKANFNYFSITTKQSTVTFSNETDIANSEDHINALIFAMKSIGYTDAGSYMDYLLNEKVSGRMKSEVLEKELWKVYDHIVKVKKIFDINNSSLEYIKRIKEARDGELTGEIDNPLETAEIVNGIINEYKKSGIKLSLPYDLKFANTIELYSPISYYNEFFKGYANIIDKQTSLKVSTQYNDGSDSTQPLFQPTSPFAQFTNGVDFIRMKHRDTQSKVVALNPIMLNTFDFGAAVQHGGITYEDAGKKQKQMDTVEFLQTYLNVYLKNIVRYSEDGVIPSVTFTDMMSDRPIIHMQEYTYSPGGTKMFQRDGNTIKTNKLAIVKAFNDIANIYKQRKADTIELYNSKGIVVIQDPDKGISYLGKEVNGERVVISKDDKASYWGLMDKYHYNTVKENTEVVQEDGKVTVVTNEYLIPGNSYTFNNAAIPVSLTKGVTKYSDIEKEYTESEVDKLIDLLLEANVSKDLSEIIPVFNDNLYKLTEDAIALNNIESVTNKKKKIINITNREQYEKSINKIKENVAKIKNKDITLSQEAIDVIIKENEVIQKDIKAYQRIRNETIKKDRAKFEESKEIMEYMIYSFLFYNTFISELSRDGSFHNNSITDFTKRAQGITAPYLETIKDNVGDHFNIIYREDSPGSYMGTYDSTLHSNGEVMFSPLTMDRFRKDSGGNLSFVSFSGQIKTNYFNSGVGLGLDPVYLKMSARTLSAFELKTRSKQAWDTLRTFMDKNIYIFKNIDGQMVYSDTVNFFNKHKKNLEKIKTQKGLIALIGEINKDINTYTADKGYYIESDDVAIDENNIIQYVGAFTEWGAPSNFGLSPYDLLPHIIAPTSSAKMYQQKVNDLTPVENANDEQFGYTMPTVNPMGGKVNSSTSMAKSSTDGMGVQNNKYHSILPEKKPIPNQIINFTGIRDTVAYDKIINSLSSLTEVKLQELLAAKGNILAKYKSAAFRNAEMSSAHKGKLDLIKDPSSVSVIQRELATAILAEFKRAVKPDMVGGTFVQRPANFHVFVKDGHVYLADEVGTVDDYTNVKGYERRKLRPFTYLYKGVPVKTKEELSGILFDNEKAKDLTVSYQEVVMDFPYRKQFHITNDQTLNDVMVINGVNFQDGDTVLTKEDIIEKINELMSTKLTGIQAVLEAIPKSKLLYIFSKNKFQSKYFLSYAENNENLKYEDLKSFIADYFVDLNKALYVYPIRIPTTGLASGFPSKIVAFANGIENTIIVPSEKSILDGSDYDIDELHVLYKPMNLGWNKNTIAHQQLIFDSIFETYGNVANANEIMMEITYKDFMNKADALRDSKSMESNVHKLTDMFKAREDLYGGERMVGYEVNAQQALMNLYISNNKAGKEKLSLPFLDLEYGGQKVGISVAIDVMSSYVNMATDNGKLGGALGALGHDTKVSTLVLGLVINGVTGEYTSHEDFRTKLNDRIYEVLANSTVSNVSKSIQVQDRITNTYDKKNSFEEELYSTIKELLENSNTSEADKTYFTEVRDALLIGVQAFRLSQINSMQDKMSTLYQLYSKVQNISNNLGVSSLSEFLEQEVFLESTEDMSTFDSAVRTSTFDIRKYAKRNPMIVSQIKMLNEINNVMMGKMPFYSIFHDMKNEYNTRASRFSMQGAKFSEAKFNAMMNGIESMMVTDFLRKSPLYKNSSISFVMRNEKEDMSFDFSNFNNVLKFYTLFPKFAEYTKDNYPDNTFARNLSIRGAGRNKQFVTIRSAETIDDGGLIQDYQNSFKDLPEATKLAFMQYALMAGGFGQKRNSLMRFIDNQILLDYSKWESELKDNLFYDIKRTTTTNVDTGEVGEIKMINVEPEIMIAIELANPELQIRKTKNRTGNNGKPIRHSGKYSPTYVTESGETLSLTSPMQSKILSKDAISGFGRLVDLTIEQEYNLYNGRALGQLDIGLVDKPNSSYPRTKIGEEDAYNFTAFNTVRVSKNLGSTTYSVIPVSTSDSKIETNSTLGQTMASYYLNAISSLHGTTHINSNGKIQVGSDQEFINNPIVDIYGTVNNLINNNYGTGVFDLLLKNAEVLKNNDIFVQVYRNLFGYKPNKNGAATFIARNYTKERMEDAFMKANTIKPLVKKDVALTEIEIKNTIGLLMNEEAFNVARLHTKNIITDFTTTLNIDKNLVNDLISRFDQITFKDVAQAQTDSRFIQGIKSNLFPSLSPTEDAINTYNEIEKDNNIKDCI
jgi:hypothetical protein